MTAAANAPTSAARGAAASSAAASAPVAPPKPAPAAPAPATPAASVSGSASKVAAAPRSSRMKLTAETVPFPCEVCQKPIPVQEMSAHMAADHKDDEMGSTMMWVVKKAQGAAASSPEGLCC